MLSFAIFAVVVYGLALPASYFAAKRYLKNTVLFPVSKFILLFLGVSALLFYLVGALGPIHLTWVIPGSLIQEISAATEEQRMGAEQINSAMQQLNSFTQDNATALDDLNAYSEALNKSFIKLNKTIGLFRMSAS